MVIHFQYFYLFLYLAAKLTHHFFRFGNHNIKAVNTFNLRGGSIQAIDIDLPAGEYNRNPAQQTYLVLCVHGDVIFLFLYFLVIHIDLNYLSLISLTLHPCGTIGNTLFSLVTITSSRYEPLWSSISFNVPGRSARSEIHLPSMR